VSPHWPSRELNTALSLRTDQGPHRLARGDRSNGPLVRGEPQVRHSLSGLNRERLSANATKMRENSNGDRDAPSFGTRGSQVQILPLRPTLSRYSKPRPDSFPDRNELRPKRSKSAKL
jgi:hypothetical protein